MTTYWATRPQHALPGGNWPLGTGIDLRDPAHPIPGSIVGVTGSEDTVVGAPNILGPGSFAFREIDNAEEEASTLTLRFRAAYGEVVSFEGAYQKVSRYTRHQLRLYAIFIKQEDAHRFKTALWTTKSATTDFETFVQQFGTHYVSEMQYGASVAAQVVFTETALLTSSSVKAALNSYYADASLDETQKAIVTSSDLSIVVAANANL